MLKLRRATVLQAGPADGPEQELTISLAGERRAAIADVGLVGSSVQGDDVIVLPSVSDDEATQKYGDTLKRVKPYLRVVPQPK